MSRYARQTGIGFLCALALAAAQAGTIEVSYDPAAAWADAGETPREREANLDALAGTLRDLGAKLPGAGAVLRVQLLDVDLAGTVRPVGRNGQMLRVMRGGADWPRLRLSWTLRDGDRELRRGEDTLSDMNYSWRDGSAGSSDPLKHEKRLLTGWFESRILGAGAP